MIGIKHDSCPCAEAGADGTVAHSETVGTAKVRNTSRQRFPVCGNHWENYKKNPVIFTMRKAKPAKKAKKVSVK